MTQSTGDRVYVVNNRLYVVNRCHQELKHQIAFLEYNLGVDLAFPVTIKLVAAIGELDKLSTAIGERDKLAEGKC